MSEKLSKDLSRKIIAVMALLIAGFTLTSCEPYFPYWEHDRGYHRGHDKGEHDRGDRGRGHERDHHKHRD